MKRLRRAAQAVTIVLGVTWSLFGVLPHQSSALSPALSNAIEANAIEVRLVAQNFNVLADTQFRFTVGVPDADVRNQLEQDPSTTLRITAFALSFAVENRFPSSIHLSTFSTRPLKLRVFLFQLHQRLLHHLLLRLTERS